VLFPFLKAAREFRRVVVTGAGIITGLGVGWDANAEGFRRGACAIKPVTLFDISRHRAKIAAQVELPAKLPESKLSARSEKRLSRGSRMLLHAGLEAFHQAGWKSCNNLPMVFGSTGCGAELGEAYYRRNIQAQSKLGQPTRAVAYQGQRQILDLSEAIDCSGPITLISNACASGSNSIGHAWELVRSGPGRTRVNRGIRCAWGIGIRRI
jgi:3-oxoacyl-[acyl-carrier-protein] synthase II